MMFGMLLLPFSFLRIWLLRACGATIGNGCYIGFHTMLDTNFPEKVIIGDNVTISYNCTFITHTANPTNSKLAKIYRLSKEVVVGDGAWIGAHSIVLPGVSIAPNCFVGAGSVVTKNTKPMTLVAGNPARPLKKLQKNIFRNQKP